VSPPSTLRRTGFRKDQKRNDHWIPESACGLEERVVSQSERWSERERANCEERYYTHGVPRWMLDGLYSLISLQLVYVN
jgi:hypothetical protein